MKSNGRTLFILFMLVSSHFAQTRIGCLSHSQNLKEPFDTKAYHPVACNCDCGSYQAKGLVSNSRNKCLNCRHYHDPRPMIIVTKIAQQAAEKNIEIDDPKHALQRLIDRYQNK